MASKKKSMASKKKSVKSRVVLKTLGGRPPVLGSIADRVEQVIFDLEDAFGNITRVKLAVVGQALGSNIIVHSWMESPFYLSEIGAQAYLLRIEAHARQQASEEERKECVQSYRAVIHHWILETLELTVNGRVVKK